MDTFPTQQVPVQQVSPGPEELNVSSDQELSQKKGHLRKFLDISTWIILFAFLPITVLIFLSQDSVPGDLFYPVKRGLENVVLAAASVNPATRAAFRTNLTETRFKEAENLVLVRSNANGLSSFIDEVQGAQLEVTNLTSDTERKTAEEKLISKIEEYQSGLSTLQAKTEQNIPLTPAPIPPSPTPTVMPSPTPRIISSQSQSSPTSIPIPTPTPTVNVAPTIAVNTPANLQESTQVLEQKKIVETIKETKEQLNKIRKDLEEKRNEKEKLKKQESDKQNRGDEKGKDGKENSIH